MATYLRYLGAALVLGLLASTSAGAQSMQWSYGPGYDRHWGEGDGYYGRHWGEGDGYYGRYWEEGDGYYYGHHRHHHYWAGRRYWESPEENVILSAHYDHLLEVSPGFRHYRMRRECGPIDFSLALRDDCLGSFDRYEPERW